MEVPKGNVWPHPETQWFGGKKSLHERTPSSVERWGDGNPRKGRILEAPRNNNPLPTELCRKKGQSPLVVEEREFLHEKGRKKKKKKQKKPQPPPPPQLTPNPKTTPPKTDHQHHQPPPGDRRETNDKKPNTTQNNRGVPRKKPQRDPEEGKTAKPKNT